MDLSGIVGTVVNDLRVATGGVLENRAMCEACLGVGEGCAACDGRGSIWVRFVGGSREGVRPNRERGTCDVCDGEVSPGAGVLLYDDAGALRLVRCRDTLACAVRQLQAKAERVRAAHVVADRAAAGEIFAEPHHAAYPAGVVHPDGSFTSHGGAEPVASAIREACSVKGLVVVQFHRGWAGAATLVWPVLCEESDRLVVRTTLGVQTLAARRGPGAPQGCPVVGIVGRLCPTLGGVGLQVSYVVYADGSTGSPEVVAQIVDLRDEAGTRLRVPAVQYDAENDATRAFASGTEAL